MQPPTGEAIVVRVIETPAKETTITDVILGALGLTTVMVLAALILGALLGGAMIGIKKLRQRYNLEPIPDSEALRVTPETLLPASSSANPDT